jgi:hypothetical protein
MKESSNLLKSIVLLAGAGMLGACGGGGGGGGDTAISASDPVSVTSANAATVAGAAVNSADGLSGSSIGLLGVPGGVSTAAVGQTSGAQIGAIDTVLQQVRRAPEILASGGSQVSAAAVQPINEACDSGSISGSFNDADNDLALSTGDSFSMTANSCDFGGVVMNGSISISNIVVNGDPNSSAFSLQLTMQASNFSVTVGSETVSMNGGATIDESSSNGIISTGFVTDGIQIGIPGETVTLVNYSMQATDNTANGEYTLDINGVISSTSLGGSVVCTTEQLLKGVDTANPYEGVIVCTGADNTRVTLNAMSDSINVELLVDENGDGVTDNTIPMLWDEL